MTTQVVTMLLASALNVWTFQIPREEKTVYDEGNDVITIAQLHITTSHGEVSGAQVSLIQGSFSGKLTVKLPGISKYGVGEGKLFP